MRRKKIKKNKKGREMITEKNEEQNAETVARRVQLKKILSGFLLQAWSAKTRGLLLISDQVVLRSCS